MQIAIPYVSGSGHTRVLARHVADGAASVAGAKAILVDVEALQPSDWDLLAGAGAIIFGCPTYMGSAAARFKDFMDETGGDLWTELRWRDKIAAGFTVATFPSGDKLSTLMQLSVFAAQHAMIWVGLDEIGAPVNKANKGINRDGSSLGLMATSSRDKTLMIDKDDAETARRFGARIARAALRWQAGA
ncbi:MAG: flavodoxin family protein [Rhodobacteraceae bacterium]|nr:flavodoxin family protein [Paracoccaceae bacterium]